MTVIWWTLYILGALTMIVVWTQVAALIGTHLKAHRDRVSGNLVGMTRKDIEAIVRMEIQSYLSKEDK